LTFHYGGRWRIGGVDVRLLYVEDCPNWRLAAGRLREALADLGGEGPTVAYQVVRTAEEAARAGFRGSPTILIDGRDPFSGPDDPVAMACRLYRCEDRVEGAPTVDQLRAAVAGAR
jgi:hypothetical protein